MWESCLILVKLSALMQGSQSQLARVILTTVKVTSAAEILRAQAVARAMGLISNQVLHTQKFCAIFKLTKPTLRTFLLSKNLRSARKHLALVN